MQYIMIIYQLITKINTQFISIYVVIVKDLITNRSFCLCCENSNYNSRSDERRQSL